LIKVEENKKKYWEILKGNSVYEIVDWRYLNDWGN
jgi:hypothetical protein